MTSRYIRKQTLTLTKSHEERYGPLADIARSAQLYGHDKPLIAFSDDPVKVCASDWLYFPQLMLGLGQAAHLFCISFSC